MKGYFTKLEANGKAAIGSPMTNPCISAHPIPAAACRISLILPPHKGSSCFLHGIISFSPILSYPGLFFYPMLNNRRFLFKYTVIDLNKPRRYNKHR